MNRMNPKMPMPDDFDQTQIAQMRDLVTPKFFDVNKLNKNRGYDDHDKVKCVLAIIISPNPSIENVPIWLININPKLAETEPPKPQEVVDFIKKDPSIKETLLKMHREEPIDTIEKFAVLVMLSRDHTAKEREFMVRCLPLFAAGLMDKTAEEIRPIVEGVIEEFMEHVHNAASAVIAQSN